MIVIASAFLRYKSGEIDYRNSDATWHALLTIEAYDETPVSQHLFLPIVSLGKHNDKHITWGATIPDSDGNYYYTSFSPAGYFFPWAFIKIFGLMVCEKSLFVFNTLLLLISAILWIYLLSLVYKETKFQSVLCFVGGMTYVLAPEILHGMGIVYWHQSILQVTLLVQIIAYYKYMVIGVQRWKWPFYLGAFVNPYIEWTGYVANIGFAIAETIRKKDKQLSEIFCEPIKIGLITLVSFATFSIHYIMRVDPITFLKVLKARFVARNITAKVALTDVFGGYYESFMYIWVLLLIFVVWNYFIKRELELRNRCLIFVLLFLTLENIIMKQHAVSYTYDRMKVAFFLIFVVCEVIRNVLESSGKKQKLVFAVVGITCLCSILNFRTYKKSPKYIWDVSYRHDNVVLAEFITNKYPNAIYASGTVIRGYMNLLFKRGIYEWKSLQDAKEIAICHQTDNLVYISKVGYKVTNILVYNIKDDSVIGYHASHGVVLEDDIGSKT